MDYSAKELTSTLGLLGLTPTEAEVYLYILERGGAKGSEIVSALGVHQPQLYNVVLSLVRKGFVEVVGVRPKMYMPVDPSTVFENAIRELRSGEKRLRSKYRRPPLWSDGSKPIAWFVKGRRNTVRTLQSVIEDASSEILLEQPITLLGSTLKQLSSAAKRGVDLYLLLYGGEITDSLKSRLSERGIREVRLTGLGHYLLCIADQATCVYAPRRLFSGTHSDAAEANTLIFKEKEVAGFFNHSFFVAWFKAKDVLPDQAVLSHRTYTNQRSALYVLSKLMARGTKPKVAVEGKNTRTGEPIRLEGRAVDIRIEEEVYSFTVDTGDSLVEVGGENALVETVTAEKIEILLEES